jgi:DNA-binding SARP family transcriptional activator
VSAAPIYAQRAKELLADLSGAEYGQAPLRSGRLDAEPPVDIRGLGMLEVRRGATVLSIDRPHARELLAVLLTARAPVHRDRLIAWLWPERSPGAADEVLRTTAASLADVIGPDRVRIDDRSLSFALGAHDTWDVADLLARGAGRSEADGTVEALTAALGDYAAPPFSEWPDAEWAVPIRRDCADALRRIRGRLAEALLADDRPEEALPHFAQLVESDREEEAWHRGLMRCHAQVGDTALALRQFHACRSIVRQTRAADPSPETQALYLELLARG